MKDGPPRFRFAPSPNGELHLGHAYSAIKTWEIAARLGGEVLLRIEDIDTGRTRQHFIDGILDDLEWLGLTWPEPVRYQAAHFRNYRAASAELLAGGLLYPCTATRKQIAAAVADQPDWPSDPEGAPLYPGIAKVVDRDFTDAFLAGGSPVSGTALRIDMDRALVSLHARTGNRDNLSVPVFDEQGRLSRRPANPGAWGDAVIVRKDTPTSYHLSVVVDDALQGITHVVRGRDLEAATDLHVLLQHLLALPAPFYHHHRLITDSAGRKLSKSLRDTSLRYLRENGWTPDDIRTAIGLPGNFY